MSVVQELKQRTSGARLFELDALRGLAASVVILHHFRSAFTEATPVWYLRPLFAGRESVVLFFVLSGYVLSLPVWRNRQPTYGRYLVRRFFRIYVPYAAGVLVALAGAYHFLNAQEPLTPWFYRTWHSPLTKKLIVTHFVAMTLSPALNTAFWSLRYEAEMSVVMPFVSRAIRFLGTIKTLIVVLLGSLGAELLMSYRPSLYPKLVGFIHYSLCFVFGAVLALNRDAIRAWYGRQVLGTKVAGLVATVVLFYDGVESLAMVATAGVIVFALHSRISRYLDTAVPEYLGWVSYSMYLVHGTVLFALLILLVGRVPAWIIFAIYIPAVLLLSHIFCKLVEQPALKLGRYLTTDKVKAATLETVPVV